jgi:hypothetical protein
MNVAAFEEAKFGWRLELADDRSQLVEHSECVLRALNKQHRQLDCRQARFARGLSAAAADAADSRGRLSPRRRRPGRRPPARATCPPIDLAGRIPIPQTARSRPRVSRRPPWPSTGRVGRDCRETPVVTQVVDGMRPRLTLGCQGDIAVAPIPGRGLRQGEGLSPLQADPRLDRADRIAHWRERTAATNPPHTGFLQLPICYLR